MARHGRLPQPVYGGCPSSPKVGYRNRESAKVAARRLAQELLATGRLVDDLYVYQCGDCHRLHLTRRSRFRGTANDVIALAPPLDAQLWAMPDHHRERVMGRLASDGVVDERVARLPDPVPEPVRQPYANRPRNLRRR